MGAISRDELVNRAMRYGPALAIRLRLARLRLLGVHAGQKCWVRSIRIPRNPWDISLGDFVALDDGVVLLSTGPRIGSPRIVVGAGTYVNRFTMLDASQKIEVGQGCLIGPYCYITDHDHAVGGRDGSVIGAPLIAGAVRIGRNVWIGAGAVVLKGVTIGDDAVVGAGAVVTRPVPAGGRVAGVPARGMAPQAPRSGSDT